jgi:hypothetical protein
MSRSNALAVSPAQDSSPDRALEARIIASLAGHHVPSLRNVRVLVDGSRIVLRGQVSSFYAKQLSQHSARRLAGESLVIDEVSVVTPASFRDPARLSQVAAAGVALPPSVPDSAPNPHTVSVELAR